jgi:hypothetical protein
LKVCPEVKERLIVRFPCHAASVFEKDAKAELAERVAQGLRSNGDENKPAQFYDNQLHQRTLGNHGKQDHPPKDSHVLW